jgi:hypothetical protein
VSLVKYGQADVSLYHSEEEVHALAIRIKDTVPGANKLTDSHAIAFAQYALITGANPFRGEVYAWEGSDGELIINDGYKLLSRWAHNKEPYSQRFGQYDGKLEDGDIGAVCYIVVASQYDLLARLTEIYARDPNLSGDPYDKAFKTIATKAVGVVTSKDMVSKRGYPINPPKGWTWEQRAETRALKNCLNRSHGMPSMREIAQESYNVDGVQTIPEDWRDATRQMSIPEMESTAVWRAQARKARETIGGDFDETGGDIWDDAEVDADMFSKPMTSATKARLRKVIRVHYGIDLPGADVLDAKIGKVLLGKKFFGRTEGELLCVTRFYEELHRLTEEEGYSAEQANEWAKNGVADVRQSVREKQVWSPKENVEETNDDGTDNGDDTGTAGEPAVPDPADQKDDA